MGVQKISQYFFILAAVIAILDGALELDINMRAIKFMILILAGVIVGVLRHHSQKEFVISGLAVVITGFIMTQFLGDLNVLANISQMIYNFIVFLSAAVVVVGIEEIANIITMEEPESQDVEGELKRLKKLLPKDIERLTFERLWGIVILIAVAVTFIILLAEAFFDTSAYRELILLADGLITILFVVDLVILYQKARNFSDFISTNVFDIIAAIPTVGVLRGLKLIRAVRIIKVMRSTGKVAKLAHLYKTGKFFSDKSYFNKVEKEQVVKQRIKKLSQKAKTKKKTSTKKKKSTKKQTAKKKKR